MNECERYSEIKRERERESEWKRERETKMGEEEREAGEGRRGKPASSRG